MILAHVREPIVNVIILALSLSMLFPAASVPQAPAASSANFQIQETNWSPFGPRTENLLITGYSDFNTMFNAFNSGSLDLTDWPLDPTHLAQFNTNPDVYITAKQAEFGIFELDINHHHALFGINQQTPRAMVAATFPAPTTGTAACSSGFGTVTVQLINRENASSTVKDKYNIVTLQEFPLGTPVFTATDASASGTYTFTCVSAENPLTSAGYTITSTEYNTTTNTATTVGAATTHLAAIAVDSQQSVNVFLTVNYLSPSTQSETQAGVYARRAISHMLDKPDFVQSDSSLAGLAVCDDIMLPPGDRLTGSGCLQPGSDPNQHGFNPVVLEQIECGPISSVDPAFTAACTVSNYLSAYHIGPASSVGAGLWWNAQHTGTSGYANPNDIRAACDYLVLDGFPLTPSGSTCAQVAAESSLATPPATYVHFVPTAGAASMVIMYIGTSAARNHFGQTIADTINFLFGTANGACMNNGGTAYSAVNYGTKEPLPCTVGTPVTPQYYTIGQMVPIVFADAGKDQWNLYTGGFSLGSTPDFLWSNFHSSFASSTCGGVFNSLPANDNYHCDPAYDAYSNAGEFAANLRAADNIFNQTALISMKTALNDPVYSNVEQFAALNCWNFQPGSQSSLVRTLGHGWGAGFAYWSLTNMRQDPNFVPTNPNYKCLGGSQNPGTIRRGLSQDTDNLNPLRATTPWDFDIINLVFDSLLKVNPTTGGATTQIIDWMTKPLISPQLPFPPPSHSATFNASEISCIGAPTFPAGTPSCMEGTTTQMWHLRNDILFHDGTPLTASDVCFSIIAQRDAPSAVGFSSVATVSSCTPISSDTLLVRLQSQSPFYELDIGSIPIIPTHGSHSWAGTCTSTYPIVSCSSSSGVGNCGGALVQTSINGSLYSFIPSATLSKCADPTWDPMATNNFVGSGPWACYDLQTGVVGGPCTSTGNEVIGLGNTASLVANHNYMRGPVQGGSWYRLNWADRDNSGIVDIVDIADAAEHYCLTSPPTTTACGVSTCNGNNLSPPACDDPYWANPLYSCPGDTWIDICILATLASPPQFGQETTSPFITGQLSNIDPQTDPFSACSGGACVTVEQILNEGGSVHLKLAYENSIQAASLTNVWVQVGSATSTFTSTGPFSLTPNSGNDLNLGMAFPSNNQVTIIYSVTIAGLVMLAQIFQRNT